MGAREPDLTEFFHDAFEAFLETVKRDTFDCNKLKNENIPGFIWTIAKRKYLRWKGKPNSWNPVSLDEMIEMGLEPAHVEELERILEEEENLQRIKLNLKKLKPREANLIRLRIFESKSFAEVAKAMAHFQKNGEMDEATARVYFHRAINNLRKL